MIVDPVCPVVIVVMGDAPAVIILDMVGVAIVIDKIAGVIAVLSKIVVGFSLIDNPVLSLIRELESIVTWGSVWIVTSEGVDERVVGGSVWE